MPILYLRVSPELHDAITVLAESEGRTITETARRMLHSASKSPRRRLSKANPSGPITAVAEALRQCAAPPTHAGQVEVWQLHQTGASDRVAKAMAAIPEGPVLVCGQELVVYPAPEAKVPEPPGTAADLPATDEPQNASECPTAPVALSGVALQRYLREHNPAQTTPCA